MSSAPRLGRRVAAPSLACAAVALAGSAVPTAATPIERTYVVFFAEGSAELRERSRQLIAEAVRVTSARARPPSVFLVWGNADREGPDEAHDARLSVLRAEAVADELVRLGVARTAVRAKGFGRSQPLVPAGGPVGEPENRSVQIMPR